MSVLETSVQDVMQVCRNGHVITDLLRSAPERALTHCDRCGATTLERCPTCGHELPGAFVVPGLQPMGVRPAPHFCSICGVAFPWTKQRRLPQRDSVMILENMLSRLTLVIRQLRVRHGDRPPFRVTDEKDLEDLVRSLLPLHFDDIRPESRTPSYAPGTRMDFLLVPQRIAVTVKLARPGVLEQVREDAAYYRREGTCRTLLVSLYDPEALLRDPCVPPADHEYGELEVRCVRS